jgi:thiol-disulfide isomerase/thioredoxin
MYRPTFLVIGEQNDDLNEIENQKIQVLKDGIKKNKHVFLFVFMNTCGPCIQTKPQWDNTQELLEKKYGNRDDYIVARMNYKFFDELGNAGSEPSGFPTLRYVKNENAEEYEDSGFGERNTDSFIQWITTKMEKESKNKNSKNHTKSKKNKNSKSSKKSSKRKTLKNSVSSLFKMGGTKTGGKWSVKYKKSINCKRPKGFSQKQHCKYGRKNWKK